MLRREFLHGLAVTAMPTLLSSQALAGPSSDRHGDLLMHPMATDHWQLVFSPSRPRPLRLLQLTDTHFHAGDATTQATEKLLREMIAREQPDFIVHTGDFVNNDSKEPVDWTGLEILNSLGVPWTLCFGNHDYPVHKADGSRSLEEIRQGMEHGYQGFVDRPTGRHYCYRYDLLTEEAAKPRASLFFFQVGYAEGDRRISDPQLAWFADQMKHDVEQDNTAPITVFVHIPVNEYHSLYESGKAIGVKGESVCFDSDTGESFKRFAGSRRVVAVFCGHDHVNNYHGDWHGVDLVYGRVTGWGGYGPASWKRGGRLITLDLANPRPVPMHREVF
jgi:3',5'-cyclic AMP phosphodiesterase CpdA